MQTRYFENHEAARLGFNRAWIIDYTDLSAAATTNTLVLESLNVGDVAKDFGYALITAFDGGATTELTVDVGYDLSSGTDDPDSFIDLVSVHADATTINNHYGIGAANAGYAANVAADIELLATATGANLSALTQGKLIVYGTVIKRAEILKTE